MEDYNLDKETVLRKWLEIDYFYMAHRLNFIEKIISPDKDLLLNTVRIIDRETTMEKIPDTNTIIALLALMWEHTDRKEYDLRDFLIKILSRIGYPTSAIIADKEFDQGTCQFSASNSVFDKYTCTLLQERNEVHVNGKTFLLTNFQKQLWDMLDQEILVGISAPTSAGKSFVILIKSVQKMIQEDLDIIYIVPTLSLVNQVTEDYNKMLRLVNIENYFITNNLTIGESNRAHTVYVWTQEKAISALSVNDFESMPNKTLLIVDEIQNVERISEDSDVRSKILYDTLQELKHIHNIVQIIISGPRIKRISNLGTNLFGTKACELTTFNSPVLNLTYSVKKAGSHFYLKQYCGQFDEPYENIIENPQVIAGYGLSSLTSEYVAYLCAIVKRLGDAQNVIFAPTSTAARNIALSLCDGIEKSTDAKIRDLISYYGASVNENYPLCKTLENKVAYHHGKLPIHVRRTIESAIKQKLISNIICTTTLMQGVNLPAQNVIIRNPHLYTRHHEGEAELTSYEMANLRGRAGRLLKDFIGRTIVLDEGEFEKTDGYDQVTLFDDVGKEVSSGYGERFEEYKSDILNVVVTDEFVNTNMKKYGYLVTYIRQSVLRYGKNAKQRMTETGVQLTSKQVAAIIMKLETLSVPKNICLHNRYWDPFVLNDIYLNFKGKVPNFPTERGARNRLSQMLKFLRDNDSTAEMYDRYIPEQYRQGQNRGLLCSTCIKWSSEVPLSQLLSGEYYTGDDAGEHIENTIKLLQDTVSFSVPLLIKPVIEICNDKSAIVSCLQTGAYKPCTRKMIEIGVPRELAIRLNLLLFSDSTATATTLESYEFELFIRERIRSAIPVLPYWEQVQLEFLA